ncbi:hypothetical protein KC325_g252 [Hortaea werneckii]|nr:hypothetical protein KC325_g252 [Hortaea werneckii]
MYTSAISSQPGKHEVQRIQEQGMRHRIRRAVFLVNERQISSFVDNEALEGIVENRKLRQVSVRGFSQRKTEAWMTYVLQPPHRRRNRVPIEQEATKKEAKQHDQNAKQIAAAARLNNTMNKIYFQNSAQAGTNPVMGSEDSQARERAETEECQNEEEETDPVLEARQIVRETVEEEADEDGEDDGDGVMSQHEHRITVQIAPSTSRENGELDVDPWLTVSLHSAIGGLRPKRVSIGIRWAGGVEVQVCASSAVGGGRLRCSLVRSSPMRRKELLLLLLPHTRFSLILGSNVPVCRLNTHIAHALHRFHSHCGAGSSN